jgi:sortase A
LGLALVAFYVIQSFNGYTSTDSAETFSGVAPTTEDSSAGGPEDKTLSLTVPEANVENASIPTSAPDEVSLRENVAVRLPSTGLPWQEETNVYIAGHELGYPFTDSFRAFYDLKETEKGDKVYINDANGTEYTYEVFETLIVQPEELWVLDPLEGRNIVSLQVSETQQKQGDVTPKRVVRAELVEKS